MPNCYLARQPIYNRDLSVYAYELLYRAAAENDAPPMLGDQATSEVLTNTLTEIGLHQLVGGKLAFINFTRNFIVAPLPLPFSNRKIVIEILEDIYGDPEVVRGVERLMHQGHLIALDDFIFSEKMRPLLKIANIVKIDILALSRDELTKHVAELNRYDVRLLAEKIETEEDYQYCRELGFELFQGYFFCRPRLYAQQRMATNKMLVLQLLTELNDPEVDIEKLVTIISQDVSLSYKLLRYINSAFFSLSTTIESIRSAVVYLGVKTIKEIATLLTLSSVNDKPHELFVIAMTRAKMCETLAVELKQTNKESFFLVGLFSVLDGLLDARMVDILDSLSLSEEINRALLHHEGLLGQTLQNVINYERGEWDKENTLQLSNKTKANAYIEALCWVSESSL